jgi:hypothetical protein
MKQAKPRPGEADRVRLIMFPLLYTKLDKDAIKST